MEVWRYIRSNCVVTIGSEGILGDKQMKISQGSSDAPLAKEGQLLESSEPIETDIIKSNLKVTAENVEIISIQLAEIMVKINTCKGTLGRLLQDETIAENLNQTIMNLKRSSKGLDENMTAVKHNFLFRSYFKRRAKATKEKQ